jgi:hypothetical protein
MRGTKQPDRSRKHRLVFAKENGKLTWGGGAVFMKSFVVVVMLLAGASNAAAGQWQPASPEVSRDLLNCLIAEWLPKSDLYSSPARWELHIRFEKGGEHTVPHKSEPERTRKPRKGLTCLKGRQIDYASKFNRDGSLILTNGRPSFPDGVIEGYTYEIKPIYSNGSKLAIYVAAGPRRWERLPDGSECLYEPISSASRHYFANGVKTFSEIGRAIIWEADIGLPSCYSENRFKKRR